MAGRGTGWTGWLGVLGVVAAGWGCAEPTAGESCLGGPLPGTAYIEQPKLWRWSYEDCPHAWAYQGVGDLDGDGRIELVGYGIEEYDCPEADEPGSGYCTSRAVVCVGSLAASPAQFDSPPSHGGLHIDLDAGGDLDGDGLDDFVIVDHIGEFGWPTLARGRADLSQLDPFQQTQLSSWELPGFAVNFTGAGVTALVTLRIGELRVDTLTGNAGAIVRHTTITGLEGAGTWAAIGDVDDDGLGDVAYLGEDGKGWVLHGGDPLELAHDQLPPDRVSALEFPGAYRVAKAGDINGDGIDDLAVAVEGGDEDHRVYVVFGGARGPVPSAAELEEDSGGFMLRGEAKVDGFAAIGDFSGDGVADLVVETRDTLHVIYGRRDIGSEDLSELARGCAWGRSFQLYYARARWTGDLDGDGRDDIGTSRGVLLTGQL